MEEIKRPESRAASPENTDGPFVMARVATVVAVNYPMQYDVINSLESRNIELQNHLVSLQQAVHDIEQRRIKEYEQSAMRATSLLLTEAIPSGCIPWIKVLISDKADVNYKSCNGLTPLTQIIKHKSITKDSKKELIKLLLAAGSHSEGQLDNSDIETLVDKNTESDKCTIM